MADASELAHLARDLLDAPHLLDPTPAAEVCPVTARHRWNPLNLDGSIEQFLQSQRAGCSLCSLVLAAVDTAKPGWIAAEYQKDVKNRNDWVAKSSWNQGGQIRATRGVGNGYLCQIWTKESSCFEFDFACSILSLTDINPPENIESRILSRHESQSTVAGRIIPDTRSTAAFVKISEWLGICVQQHGVRCQSPRYFPRRVLDVGHFSDGAIHWNWNSESDVIRLIQDSSSTDPAQDKYIALSYCWGPDTETMAKTTRASLPSNLNGITLASLPQTFRDAVTVSRSLGIRYLWVDSLCIVQDDDEDWKRESAEMHAIYSSSYFTIAAHVGASVQDGFLGPQLYGQSDWQTEMQVSVRNARYEMELKTFLLRKGDSRKETSPLELRGWTMQECILSPRILHFERYEMMWECKSRHVCECLNLSGGSIHHAMLKTRIEIAQWESGPPMDHRWEALVELYTRRKLSYESDKLVAIAALAQRIVSGYLEYRRGASASASPSDNSTAVVAAAATPTVRSVYLAGLFRHALYRHLLWRTGEVDIGNTRDGEYEALRDASWGRRPVQYRAPTWSWASVNTPIIYKFMPDKPLQSRIAVNRDECFSTLAVEADPTGPVTYAQLSLRGHAVPVKVFTVDSTSADGVVPDFESSNNWTGTATAVRSSNGYWVSVAADLRRDVDVRTGDAAYGCWMSKGCNLKEHGSTGGAFCEQCDIESDDDWDGAQFCCFRVAATSYVVYFLVLRRSSCASDEAWERIAIGIDWVNSSRLFDGADDRILRIV